MQPQYSISELGVQASSRVAQDLSRHLTAFVQPLLAWLDATAFDATQDRFLFPILPLWSVVLVLVITLGAEAAGRKYGIDER